MADKKLRVCLSSKLPISTERTHDYYYLAYDKLELYAGDCSLDENFVISHEMPAEPVPGMIYILDKDGSVHRVIDYSDIVIADIEDESQIEILKKAGTVFYINANRRYLDKQTRSLTLPFSDGTYELNVAMRNNQAFTNDTILKYNEDNKRFEIYGPDSDEFIDFSEKFRGGETESVNISVDGNQIKGNIKVSSVPGNIIRIASDGLIATIADKVDKDTFDEWKADIDDFKKYAQDVIDNIDANIMYIQDIISVEYVTERILYFLNERYGDIDIAIEKTQEIIDSLDDIETDLMEYATTTILGAHDDLEEQIKDKAGWEELDDSSTTYSHEVNYTQKVYDFYHPKYTKKQIKLIVSAAAMASLETT